MFQSGLAGCIWGLVAGLQLITFAAANERLSGPSVHDNLAIYFIHGASDPGPVPISLEEALANNAVRVHETGRVDELMLENLGNQEVFIQAGDIVKGGQQDRSLLVSMLLRSSAGRVPIAAFCVEQGRWAKRGLEDARAFATAADSVPSRKAMVIAARALSGDARVNYRHRRSRAGTEVGSAAGFVHAQEQMWYDVSQIQQKLSRNVGTRINSRQSESSLQLALEHDKLKQAYMPFLDALSAALDYDETVIGYVVAIDGKLSAAHVYPSNGLFRKMWPKRLKAHAIEAIGEKATGSYELPSVSAVQAFLEKPQQTAVVEPDLERQQQTKIVDGDQNLYVETSRADGAWIHRAYFATKNSSR